GAYRDERRSAGEALDEPQPRAAAVGPADLELVGERLDDRDPEAALLEVVRLLAGTHAVVLEPLAGVRHFDDESIVVQLVENLDHTLAAVVGVTDRVRARLRKRELEIGEHVLGESAQPREPRQCEAAQRDVLRLCRYAQPHSNCVALATCHRTPTSQVPSLSKL